MSEHDETSDESLEEVGEALESALEMDTQTQIFLEMRQQNIELLKICVEMAGLSGQHPQLKPHDVKGAVRSVWDIYSELYAWIDPEESENDDDEEDDEDDL